jgi:hypothetical protein
MPPRASNKQLSNNISIGNTRQEFPDRSYKLITPFRIPRSVVVLNLVW